MWPLVLISACTTDDPTPTGPGPTTPGETTTPPEPAWGVTEDCSAEEPGGFGPLYADGTAILAYGDAAEDEALAGQVFDWYAGYFDDLQLRRASELTAAERAEDLMIVGRSPRTR
jgi:hypothetical protein